MRATSRFFLAGLALLLGTAASGQTVTSASAAASAAAAVPSTAQVKSSVSLTEQQNKFGTYTPGSNEGLFAGGKGDATPQGTTRKTGCAGTTTDPECWAIQSLQNARANPTTWVPLNGPQLTGRNAVVTDPTTVLGFDPAQVAQAATSVQCTTDTINTPEVREENHCYVSTPNVALNCSLGVEVVVDPDYVYKCLVRTATNSSVACSVGQVVTVDSTTTYQCVERLRSNQANACFVNRIVEVDANTNYVCVNQVRQAADTQCTVGTVVEVRADANYQCIDQARTVANAACSVGQVVTIDPRFNYTCTNTPNAVTTNNCSRKLTVDCVEASPCVGLAAVWETVPGQSAPISVTFNNTTAPNVTAVLRVEFDATLVNVEFRLKLQPNPLWTSAAGFGLFPNPGNTRVYINGVLATNPSMGNPSPQNGTTSGWNHYRLTSSSGLPPPQVAVFFQTFYGLNMCTQPPPTCSDTWDETACAPYKSRL